MSRARATGTNWESRCAHYYSQVLGTPVRRLAQHGVLDIGDLEGIYLHAAEAKAHRRWDVLEWVRQDDEKRPIRTFRFMSFSPNVRVPRRRGA